MNHTNYYCIADFCFSVSGTLDLDNVLPTFAAFRIKPCREEDRLFVVNVLSQLPEIMDDSMEVETSDNDMGQVRLLETANRYCIELKYEEGRIHSMQTDKLFTAIQVQLCIEDRHLLSLIHI